jgi:5-methylcytosine-specific restriction endonuclease McrA
MLAKAPNPSHNGGSMQLVLTSDRTTLLLNSSWQAFGFMNARACFKKLITNQIKGVDSDGNVVSWYGDDLDRYPAIESSLSWKGNRVGLFENHPYMRSAPDPLTGEPTRHYIPTIAVCSHHFGFRSSKGDSVSTRTIYNIYKGVCQYCHEHIPLKDATKDHVYPKHLGGSNHDFNLVLACRACNNKKDNIYPYFDKNGKEVIPRKVVNGLVVDVNTVRPEWKVHLFMD